MRLELVRVQGPGGCERNRQETWQSTQGIAFFLRKRGGPTMRLKKCICYPAILLFVFLYATVAEGVIPRPFRIGGTVTIGVDQLTQTTDAGYTFVVKKQDGTPCIPRQRIRMALTAQTFI